MKTKNSESRQLTDGSQNYTSTQRFKTVTPLMAHYDADRKSRRDMQSWVEIQNEYDCKPYNEKGKVYANFGQLRFKVDQSLSTFVDLATERARWARIETDEGVTTSQCLDWSEHISAAFQKYCIKPWKQKFIVTMLMARDMLMFGKGAYHFEGKYCCYPDYIEIGKVWPDQSAKILPSSFDICHIEISRTAGWLYRKVKKDTSGKWKKNAVLAMIKSNSSLKNHTHDSIWDKLESGDSSITDNRFDLIMSLVREYDDEGDGNISVYVYPSMACLETTGMNDSQVTDYINGIGFLYHAEKEYECHQNVVGVVAQTVSGSFYEDPSFAQLILSSSRVYNRTVNRILEAVEDSMRIYLESEDETAWKKLKKMRHGAFNLLPPGVKITQDRMSRQIADAIGAVRTVTQDNDAGIGQYKINASSTSGGTKTATQSEIDLSESTKISSAAMKVYNTFMTFMMNEIYRRFTTKSEEHTKQYDGFLKFKKYLAFKGVPASAWNPENCDVESIISLGAGSPAAKLQGARVIREALSTAARSKGELAAQKMMIAAVVGQENVSEFLPEADVSVPEDSLIGLENDALSNPLASPKNVAVQEFHMHMRHLPAHIQDASISIEMAGKILQGMSQLPKADAGIYLKQIQDILIGVDNKLAHASAHIQIASEDQSKSKQAELSALAQQIGSINKAQDDIEAQIAAIQEQRAASGGADADAELTHKQKMFALVEEHEAQMLALKYQNAQVKGEQLRIQSQENAANKNELNTQLAIHKANVEQIKAAATIKIKKNESGSATNKK